MHENLLQQPVNMWNTLYFVISTHPSELWRCKLSASWVCII